MGRNWVALWTLLFLVMSCGLTADVIKEDPNTPGNARTTPQNESSLQDERLVKPVTYFSSYTRLQPCLNELSDISGIRIRTGANSRDWQVQDLPLVVCANEMPLGKLLANIATCTHLSLSSEIVDDQTSYRVSRSGTQTRQLQAFFDSRAEEQIAREKQGWDTMVRLSRLTPEQFAEQTNSPDTVLYDKCSMIAGLGSEIRDRVFAGEHIRLEYDDIPAAARPGFEKTAQSIWLSRQKMDEKWRAENPLRETVSFDEFRSSKMDRCRLEVELISGGDGDQWMAQAQVVTPVGPGWVATGDIFGHRAVIPGADMPDNNPAPDQLPEGYQLLTMVDGKWQSVAGLDVEVELEKWDSSEDPTPADLLQALAKSSGIDIIYEDFFSHSRYSVQALRSLFGRNAKVIDFLTGLKDTDSPMTYSPRWLYNDQDKVLVGWAHKWQFRHRNLVKADVYNRLKTQINASGVELDDYLQAGQWTEGQRWDWVHSDRDLSHLIGVGSIAPVWKLYAELSVDDKQLARTEAGLPLAKLGVEVAKRVVDEQNQKLSDAFDPEHSKMLVQIPCDSASLQRLSMRVKRVDGIRENRYTYYIELVIENEVIADLGLGMRDLFPICTPQRKPVTVTK